MKAKRGLENGERYSPSDLVAESGGSWSDVETESVRHGEIYLFGSLAVIDRCSRLTIVLCIGKGRAL